MKKIFVTDGNTRAALAIVRNLGKHGYEVYVGSNRNTSLAGCSKYSKGNLIYHDPATNINKFIESIKKLVLEYSFDVLLPVTDISTISIASNKKELPASCKIPIPSLKSLQFASNKYEVFKLAQKLEIPIPKTFFIESLKQIPEIQSKFNYPIVLKPAKSRIVKKGKWISTSVHYAYDEQKLNALLKLDYFKNEPFLIQEKIIGPGVGTFVLIFNKKLITIFGHERIREKPPSGGVSTLRKSISVTKEMRSETQRILNESNWNGVAMVEFKKDLRDNRLKLMEINGRFWGSLQLAIDAGIDFPILLIKTIVENKKISNVNYKEGIKTRWLLGDIDALLMYFFKKKKLLNLPANFPSRFRYFLSFLKFFEKNQKYEIESLTDIRPFIFEIYHYLIKS